MAGTIRVVVDKDIPFIKGVLEPYGSVVYLAGKDFTRDVVADADALIIRTRTKCDAELLSGSGVKAIFSATIGTDHIDTGYCAENGIAVYSAAGCNAWGVVQYVITSLYALAERHDIDIDGKIMGIIGAGNVGERLAWFASRLGFKVLRCDPPERARFMRDSNRAASRGLDIDISSISPADYYDLDEVLRCADILSVHLPLNVDTKSFCSEQFFGRLKKGAIFINSSRGEVVDEDTLLKYRNLLGGLIVDVWRGEPDINPDLLKATDIATAHIAGYSFEGKVNATTMTLNSFAAHFGIEALRDFIAIDTVLENSCTGVSVSDTTVAGDTGLRFDYHKSRCTNLARIFASSYNVLGDDTMLRQNPERFEYIRANYAFRREFSDELIDFVSL